VLTDRAAYFRRWAELHGGYDPLAGSRLVRWWLGGLYAVARPIAAAGVAPGAVTTAAVALGYAVVGVATAGPSWAPLAALLVALSGYADGLDGAVAILRDRVSRWGFVVDSVADRATDAAYLLALWVLGAPGGLCCGAAAAVVLLEYGRARAGNAGMGEIGVVTVGERPTRVVVTAAFLLAAGVLRSRADLAVTLGAAATLGVAAVGATQLAVVVRRVLR
jgi:CDP-diacylglycerol--glycerol-3-phosphate 3-phosphatidyltransferase